MQDMLDFLEDLKELNALYNSGDLRNYDFETKIQKYERIIDAFDAAMDQAYKESAFYNPDNEV